MNTPTPGINIDPNCMDDYDPQSLDPDQALARILDAVTPVNGIEKIALRTALGRVLARDIQSSVDVPPHTNSAMDGYAVRSADVADTHATTLQVVGTALAGKIHPMPVNPGQCVRIMTGAVMPDGTDTVVIQEHVEREGELIRLDGNRVAGDNVRAAGEDIAVGDVVLGAGHRILPADLGLLASLGMVEVAVVRRLRVAFFSTGDELRSLGETLGEGEIYDSNRYTLFGMLERLGAEKIDMGVVRDRREDVRRAFEDAAACADVIISSGGVSVGEADYIKEILREVGQIQFWKVAMKPGRPLAFGKVRDAFFFGLPGNPVSVMVTFYQFVQPALRRLMGEQDITTLQIKARSVSHLKKRPGRVEYQRGILKRAEDGGMEVHKTGAQGSGILSSMAQANCFIVLPMECAEVEPGSEVDVQPFESLT
jgi:molybdopterin molybdotransferase